MLPEREASPRARGRTRVGAAAAEPPAALEEEGRRVTCVQSGARRERLRITNLAEGFFRHLRRGLGRFLGCVNSAHCEHALGCFMLACEQAHA
jgi:hypothetical protein